jgi:hypothetical protein
MRTLPRSTRIAAVLTATAVLILGPATVALACGALVAPNGTVQLGRTTTLAAYHDGIEHYVTSFTFSGKASGTVGSIVPLPGVPTDVIKGGDWTLQRLVLETQPPTPRAAFLSVAGAAEDATVLFTTKVDALDITVLEGGGTAVGNWARENGFFLPPDAPEVLDFYGRRSPIFMAVKFNLDRAREQGVLEGQGTPVHVVIPTPDPWVPLRILGLGQDPSSEIDADVYLLTDRRPATLPEATPVSKDSDQQGLIQQLSEPASNSLLQDLRSDRGMKWLPGSGMWLTYLRVHQTAGTLTHDLAIDASGYGQPDPIAAGFEPRTAGPVFPVLWVTAIASMVLLAVAAAGRRATVRVR